MISFLVSVVLILALSACMSIIFRKRFEFTLPMSLAIASLILYLFSLFDMRSTGLLAIKVGILSISAYTLITALRSKVKNLFIDYLYPGLLLAFLIIIIALIVGRGFVFSEWDEFSHWGLILKMFFLTDGLSAKDTAAFFHNPIYPVGYSLILNYFTSFSDTFNESNALRGFLFLSFSQLAILFIPLKKKGIKKNFLIALSVLLLPAIFFPGFYGTIYADAFLGLVFANIVLFHFYYRKIDWFYLFYMSLQLYLLVSTKQVGVILALIATISFTADHIKLGIENGLALRHIAKKIFPLALPISTIFLTYLSWETYTGLNEYNTTLTQIHGATLKDVKDFILGEGPEYRYTTLKNFIYTFTTIRQFGGLSFSYFLWLASTLSVFLILKRRNSGNRVFTYIAILSFVYFVFLLGAYLFTFIEYEALRLSSAERYIGTYLVALIVTCFATLITERYDYKRSISVLFLITTMFVLYIAPLNHVVRGTVFSKTANIDRQGMRAQYDIQYYTNKMSADKDKVWIISQHDAGFDYWVLRYNFAPIKVSPNLSWSLGEPLDSSDIWSVPKSIEQWKKELQDYSYVYLHSINKQFIKDYGSLFMIPEHIDNKSLYKVINNGDSIKLVGVK